MPLVIERCRAACDRSLIEFGRGTGWREEPSRPKLTDTYAPPCAHEPDSVSHQSHVDPIGADTDRTSPAVSFGRSGVNRPILRQDRWRRDLDQY